MQAAEGAGLPAEAMRKLEEQAAEQGMRTLWKVHLHLPCRVQLADAPCQGAKLEVESVVRETCERVLSDPSVSREKQALRVVALGFMGDVSPLQCPGISFKER